MGGGIIGSDPNPIITALPSIPKQSMDGWLRILKYDWLRFKDYVSFEGLKHRIEVFIRFYNHRGQEDFGRKGHQEMSGQSEAFGDKREKEKPICLGNSGLNMVLRPYLIFPLTIQK